MKSMQSSTHRIQRWLIALLAVTAASLSNQTNASPEMPQHGHDNHASIHMNETMAVNAAEDHSHHMQAMKSMNSHGYSRSMDNYELPPLELKDTDGKTIRLEKLLNTDQPLMVNFIYTSCTTICPILSATFSQAQQQMGEAAKGVKWLSFSIDPEYDTPSRLREYAKRFHAGSNWQFITGNAEQIISLQKAFGVYFGSKANHKPVTLMRAGPKQPWVRLEGLTSGAELVAEYRKIAR